MTVSEILQLPSFLSAKVIAGKDGIDNAITSSMILEAPDIENWGREGQMIITSFFALQNMSDEKVSDFFNKLSVIGISAIVFKPERFISTAPEKIIRLCDKHMIPLIQIPKYLKYESILIEVMEHALDANLKQLNRFFDVHNQMMIMALKHPTIRQILSYLKKSLHVDATLYNKTKNKRISTNQNLYNFVEFEPEKFESDRYRHYRYYRAKLTYESGESKNVIAVAVPSSDRSKYFLIIHGNQEQDQSIDVMTIENVVSLLQMEILKENALKQQLFIQNNNTIHDLLIGRYSSHEKIDDIMAGLNLDLYSNYQVLLVNVHFIEGDVKNQSEIMLRIRLHIKEAYPELAYFENNDQIVFLHNHEQEKDELSIEKIRKALDEIKVDFPDISLNYLAILSESGDRYSITALNREVLGIYRLFDNKKSESKCVRYSDLGIYKLFLNIENPSELEAFIDPRIRRVKQDNPDFMKTLVTLCENNLNAQQASKILFLHPKTIQYRISRIKQIYDIDIHDTNDILQILMAGKIFQLLSEPLDK